MVPILLPIFTLPFVFEPRMLQIRRTFLALQYFFFRSGIYFPLKPWYVCFSIAAWLTLYSHSTTSPSTLFTCSRCSYGNPCVLKLRLYLWDTWAGHCFSPHSAHSLCSFPTTLLTALVLLPAFILNCQSVFCYSFYPAPVHTAHPRLAPSLYALPVLASEFLSPSVWPDLLDVSSGNSVFIAFIVFFCGVDLLHSLTFQQDDFNNSFSPWQPRPHPV